MRITKRIQEYITKKVNEKYVDYDKTEREAHEKARQEMEKWCEQQTERMNQEFLERYPDAEINRYSSGVFRFNSYDIELPEYKPYREASLEKSELVRNAIEDIILRMELGGTKEELDAMLSELGAKEG